MASLKAGDVLRGEYKTLRRLGTGGWGAIYLAESLSLDLKVAIKSIKRRPDLEDYDQIRQLFGQEARISARLTHPNIIRFYELIRDDYDLYLVVEYAEQGTLTDRLKATGPLSIGEALDISIAICQALDYVHRHGIVHGDVRPSNILFVVDRDTIGEHIVYKLSDFGFAVDMHQQSQPEDAGDTDDLHPLGAWPYTSPEELKREPVDGRADIYSLGVTLYEMLTGEPPFPLKNQSREAVNRVIRCHLQDPIVSPQRKRSGLCIQVNQTVLRMLEKNPADRYENAAQLLEALYVARKAQEEWEKELGERYQEAIRLFDKGKWQAAVEKFEELLAGNAPYDDLQQRLDGARGQIWLAQTFEEAMRLMGEEKWKEAIPKWNGILSKDETYRSGEAGRQRDEAQTQIDLAEKYRQALEIEKQKLWEQAIRLFSEILSVRPGFEDVSERLANAEKRRRIQTNYKAGLRYLESQEWDKAITKLQAVVDEDSSYEKAAANLEWAMRRKKLGPLYQEGKRYLERENWPEATQKLQEVVDIDPSYRDAARQLHQVRRIIKESQATPSADTVQPIDTQLDSSSLDWRKILWVVLVEGVLVAIITKLIDIYVGTFSPIRLVFLGLGIVMIMLSFTLGYEAFIIPWLKQRK